MSEETVETTPVLDQAFKNRAYQASLLIAHGKVEDLILELEELRIQLLDQEEREQRIAHLQSSSDEARLRLEVCLHIMNSIPINELLAGTETAINNRSGHPHEDRIKTILNRIHRQLQARGEFTFSGT